MEPSAVMPDTGIFFQDKIQGREVIFNIKCYEEFCIFMNWGLIYECQHLMMIIFIYFVFNKKV